MTINNQPKIITIKEEEEGAGAGGGRDDGRLLGGGGGWSVSAFDGYSLSGSAVCATHGAAVSIPFLYFIVVLDNNNRHAPPFPDGSLYTALDDAIAQDISRRLVCDCITRKESLSLLKICV